MKRLMSMDRATAELIHNGYPGAVELTAHCTSAHCGEVLNRSAQCQDEKS